MASYVLPLHIQIYQREGVKWFIYEVGAPFYNPTSTPMNTKHVASQLNMTEEQVIIELFRIKENQAFTWLPCAITNITIAVSSGKTLGILYNH